MQSCLWLIFLWKKTTVLENIYRESYGVVEIIFVVLES